jgi:hypothetical protein
MTTTTNEYLVISKLTTGGGAGNCYDSTQKLLLDGGNLKDPSDAKKIESIVPGVTITAAGTTAPPPAGSIGSSYSPLIAANATELGDVIKSVLGGTTIDTISSETLGTGVNTELTTNAGITLSADITTKISGDAFKTVLKGITIDSETLGNVVNTELSSKSIDATVLGDAIKIVLGGTIIGSETLGTSVNTELTNAGITLPAEITTKKSGDAFKTVLKGTTIDSETLGKAVNDEIIGKGKLQLFGGKKSSRKPRGGKTKHRKYSSHSTKHNKNKNKKVRRTSKIIP